jgi:hypothetical protein
MPAPHEIVASPLTVYLAPVGTVFPDVDAEPTSPTWTKLGTSGSKNYDDAGVDISHEEEVSDFTPAGSTMSVKRFRTGESFEATLNLVDLSPDMYALIMNNASVTETPPGVGQAGTSLFSLFRGDQVNAFAVVLRGQSSVDNDLNMDYRFSRAFVSASGSVNFNKGEPARLAVTIKAVKYLDADKIEVEIQTAEAS